MEYPRFEKCTDQPNVPIATIDRTDCRTATGLMMLHDCQIAASTIALEHDQLMQIATHIHYPECWDTMAYPTLADAVCEITCCDPEQCTHEKPEIGE